MSVYLATDNNELSTYLVGALVYASSKPVMITNASENATNMYAGA